MAAMRKKRKEEEAKRKEEDAAAKREEELMQWLEEKGTWWRHAVFLGRKIGAGEPRAENGFARGVAWD